MKKIILAVTITFYVSTYVYALDTGIETGETKKTDREQSLQQKKSKDEGHTAEVSIDLYTLYLPALIKLEKTDDRFKECHIISRPSLLKDFGLTAEISPGVYDTIYASILKTAGDSNSPISEFTTDEGKIRKYRDCLAMYGAVIAQAYKHLKTDIGSINSTVGREDLKDLTDISVQTIVGFDRDIRQLYLSIVSDKTPCQFNGSISNIACGNSMFIISAKPSLYLNQTEVYGSKYFGYSGSFKVSSSSKKTKEAVQSMKKGISKSKTSKFTISPSKFLPQP